MRKTSKARKKISTLSIPGVTMEEGQSQSARDVALLREMPSEQKKKEARRTLYLTRYE